jgi:hypothetical protein
MTSVTSPLAARPKASVAWLWRRWYEVNISIFTLTPCLCPDPCFQQLFFCLRCFRQVQ